MTQKERYAKKLLTLRSHLTGARYFNALAALEFAQRYHVGTRKDGVTPEFQHQVEIALYVLTLPDLQYREEAIATIFLHDVREDYGVADGEIQAIFNNDQFAGRVARAVDCMTKEFRGVKRDEAEVFQAIANDPIASIAKGADRVHNLNSMLGVFTVKKQKEYVDEVVAFFLPMLKTARRLFPHQVNAYENIKFVLETQLAMIRATWPAEK